MPRPIPDPTDQLLSLQLDAKTSLARDAKVLDLRLYWLSLASGGQIRGFGRLNPKGKSLAAGIITEAMRALIVASKLSEEELEESLGVDALIIRDLRRRSGIS